MGAQEATRRQQAGGEGEGAWAAQAIAVKRYRVRFGSYAAAIGLTKAEAEAYLAKWNAKSRYGSLWPEARMEEDFGAQ